MAELSTRDQIVNVALSLFNQYGFNAVTMRHIADRLGVDRRNITYHFSKEDLLKAIAEQMWAEQKEHRSLKRDFPSFENLDKEIILYNRLQQKYAFIFKDLYVIQHPLLHDTFKSFCQTMVSDSEQAVAFSIQQGNMKPEAISGTYHALCESVFAISISWLQLQSLRNIEDLDQIRKLIWSQIIPHFTEKGIASFQAFFGKSFYESLGPSFSVELNTVIF